MFRRNCCSHNFKMLFSQLQDDLGIAIVCILVQRRCILTKHQILLVPHTSFRDFGLVWGHHVSFKLWKEPAEHNSVVSKVAIWTSSLKFSRGIWAFLLWGFVWFCFSLHRERRPLPWSILLFLHQHMGLTESRVPHSIHWCITICPLKWHIWGYAHPISRQNHTKPM